MRPDFKQLALLTLLTFAGCFAIATYWQAGASLIDTLKNALLPFITGAAIAYIVNIVMSSYEKLWRILFPKVTAGRRAVSLILAYATFIIVVVTLVSIVIPDLVSSLRVLLQFNPSDIQKLLNDINDNPTVERILDMIGPEKDISSLIAKYSRQISSQAIGILTGLLTSATGFASGLLNAFISLIFSIYILASKETLGQQSNLLVATYLHKIEKPLHRIRLTAHESFRGFFVGQTIEAIILGSLCSIGMTLLKFPYAGTVGILLAFTSLVPVVGAYVGVTIGAILIMTQSIEQAFGFVIFVVILQQFEGNLIYPRVVGNSIGLPAMWVILSITVGGALSGVLGMLLAVPLAATFYKLLKYDVLHRNQQLET